MRRLAGLVRRQFLLIVGTMVLALGLAAIALVVVKPTYMATALLVVDPSQSRLLDDDNGALSEDARIESEVGIIQSQSVLLNAIEQMDLRGAGDDLQQVLGQLQAGLFVDRRALTNLIEISYTSLSPNLAAETANTIATAYIADQVSAKVTRALEIRDILNARIGNNNATLVDNERALDAVIFSNLTRIITETGKTDIALLKTRLDLVQRDRINLEQSAQLLDQNIRQDNWQPLSDSLGLTALTELEAQLDVLNTNIATARVGTQLLEDLQSTKAAVTTELKKAGRDELARLRGSARTAQGEVGGLQNQIKNAVLASTLPIDLANEVFQLQQNAGNARDQHQALLSRLRQVETQANLQVADSRIISNALPPTSSQTPNVALILTLAGVAGLVLGIGLGRLNERYIGGFTNGGQIEAVLKRPVLAEVPVSRDEATVRVDGIIENPLAGFSTCMRQVRVGIDKVIRRTRQDGTPEDVVSFVVMIGSALVGEGKTNIALALARTYALTGQRTLLIDADMQQPDAQKLLKLVPTKGLFDYLNHDGKAPSLAPFFLKDTQSSLSVVVGSDAVGVPTDQLLAGKRFATLVESARRHFDIIIIDTPAAKTLVDGLYVAQFADYLALVVKWAETSQSDVRIAMEQLCEALPKHAEIGVILNQVSERPVSVDQDGQAPESQPLAS